MYGQKEQSRVYHMISARYEVNYFDGFNILNILIQKKSIFKMLKAKYHLTLIVNVS